MASSFKFTKETTIVALVFFIIYTFYGLFKIPFPQYLTSLAVGGIAYGIFDSYEIAVVFLLAINFVFPLFTSSPKVSEKEGFMNVNPAEISARIARMRNPEVVGVGSPMSEGFENPDADGTLSTTSVATPPVSTGVSTPAPAPATAAAAATAPAESFQDGQAGLFKIGQIPAESKGGFHIDAGTTVMNALNALKPDQIQMMTKDTKQLIDTQKSLMNMLKTFSPMVNEGKQMMETFQSMFGANGTGSAGRSLGAATNILGAGAAK
jgi:hypothetical protein